MDNDRSAGRGASSVSLAVPVTAGLLIAVLVAGAVAAFARYRVCDQQATSAGKVVEVCRHLTATDPPAVAVGLVILALLGFFYTEISGFGFSLKRDVARAAGMADSAQGTAASAIWTARMPRNCP